MRYKYGNSLYSITTFKTSGGEEPMYQVALIQNGTAETVMMNGSSVAYNSDNRTPAQ